MAGGQGIQSPDRVPRRSQGPKGARIAGATRTCGLRYFGGTSGDPVQAKRAGPSAHHEACTRSMIDHSDWRHTLAWQGPAPFGSTCHGRFSRLHPDARQSLLLGLHGFCQAELGGSMTRCYSQVSQWKQKRIPPSACYGCGPNPWYGVTLPRWSRICARVPFRPGPSVA